jgi:hypothetical protein
MTMNLDHKYDELFQAVSEMRLLCVKSPGDEQLALTFDKVMPQTTVFFSTIGSAIEDLRRLLLRSSAARPAAWTGSTALFLSNVRSSRG